MRTKNSKPLTRAEREHLLAVKGLSCSVCGEEGPSDAHHIEQGRHFLTIPCCKSCHTSSHNGIHGRKHIWDALKKTEMSCLNDTIRSLYGVV
jgi:hypothetical protein